MPPVLTAPVFHAHLRVAPERTGTSLHLPIAILGETGHIARQEQAALQPSFLLHPRGKRFHIYILIHPVSDSKLYISVGTEKFLQEKK